MNLHYSSVFSNKQYKSTIVPSEDRFIIDFLEDNRVMHTAVVGDMVTAKKLAEDYVNGIPPYLRPQLLNENS